MRRSSILRARFHFVRPSNGHTTTFPFKFLRTSFFACSRCARVACSLALAWLLALLLETSRRVKGFAKREMRLYVEHLNMRRRTVGGGGRNSQGWRSRSERQARGARGEGKHCSLGGGRGSGAGRGREAEERWGRTKLNSSCLHDGARRCAHFVLGRSLSVRHLLSQCEVDSCVERALESVLRDGAALDVALAAHLL